MGETIKNSIFHDVVFWVCLVTTIVLMVVGFLLPPTGEIHPSILQAIGWLFGFAALWRGGNTINNAIKAGYDAKWSHGDSSIEVHNK